MPRFRFVYNLKKDTSDAGFRERIRPSAYLLAPNNATRQLRAAAAALRHDGLDLYADNGNYEIIGKVMNKHIAASKTLFELLQKEQKRLGRTLRGPELPASLRAGYIALANASLADVSTSTRPYERIAAAQLLLNPNCVIGVEDPTMAVWIGLGIEPDYLKKPRSFYSGLNERVVAAALRAAALLPSEVQRHYYPVASAMSYDTAFDAGKAFAGAAIPRVSMGFGAFMSDDHYTDCLEIGGKMVKLGMNVPKRYVRTVAVSKAFWKGYGDMGKCPDAFHFLGLGAPIIIPVVGLCAWKTSDLSFDATSPIKDAIQGFLYTSQPAYMKARTYNIAFHLASGKFGSWDCPCPFCTEFVKKHPFAYRLGRTWFAKQTRSSVVTPDLRPSGGLYKAYPLLSEPSGGVLRGEVNYARIGHNHWVIGGIFADMQKNATSLSRFTKYVRKVVDDYMKATNSKMYANAMNFVYSLAVGED